MPRIESDRWIITVLSADDDEDDRELIDEALAQVDIAKRVQFVRDGQELIEYLRHEAGFGGGHDAPRPSIILLDLNMPRKSGYEALREIKADARLRQIPIVVLTTSSDQSDVNLAYDLGASSYIAKPFSHGQLVDALHTAMSYWTSVELPDRPPE